MKTIWIIIGVIVLIAVIYLIYQKTKDTSVSTVIIPKGSSTITPISGITSVSTTGIESNSSTERTFVIKNIRTPIK